MTRVFITAPTPALRAGLRAMLTTADLETVGEAPTLDQLAPEELAGVDVVVVASEELPADIATIVANARALAIIVLANATWPVAQLRGLALRGWGIAAPDAPVAELQAAVLAAAQGLVVLPPALAEQLLGQRPEVEPADLEPLDEPLTAREREVLQLLSQGLPNKLIARELQISEHTVKFHVSSLYAKLGAASRTDAVSRGARRGLITL